MVQSALDSCATAEFYARFVIHNCEVKDFDCKMVNLGLALPMVIEVSG
jgi:hypothetical protein